MNIGLIVDGVLEKIGLMRIPKERIQRKPDVHSASPSKSNKLGRLIDFEDE